jgi:carbamoyltransferase
LSLIIGLCSGPHDAAACLYDDYELLAAVPLERLTRNKAEGRRLPEEAIDELLAIAGAKRRDIEVVCLSRGHMPARYMSFAGPAHAARRRIQISLEALIGRERHAVLAREHFYAGTTETADVLKVPELLRGLGFRADGRVYAYNHHFAHSLPCLFHNPDWDEALLYTSDAGGDGISYSHRWLRNGKLIDVFGGDEWLVSKPRIDSIAYVYGAATEALGYKIGRHEGKLTGLAAWGEPTLYEALAKRFRIDKAGQIHSDFRSYRQVRSFVRSLAKGQRREDVSASVQRLVEDFTLRAVGILLETYPSRNLGVSGGLFANVRLNQKLIETGAIDRIFVYPAMSDQGLCTGGVLAYLLERDGLATWLGKRRPLESLYLGRDYSGAIDRHLEGLAGVRRLPGNPVDAAVEKLVDGEVVAIYTDRMEFGPRALGARSVLASPADAAINDELNQRMERSEFMPLAPYVALEDADLLFDIPAGAKETARFMTITCDVRPEWRDRIPAVVHVDGTARPQLVERDLNPLYYDILAGFKARTGLPALINTSFNVHEEPIIDTPAQCAKALLDDRVDYVVTTEGLYGRG